ncbi:MAG: hypothetical protein OXM03_02915 [Chloroflexota bacterium]|nr:hypothetical protein [Chloroflexota bacterium]MDE2839558.1 hypothetical protein [Chloroflexota bacterium]MDE2931610.1 hypothetical protein [Chloroflexota bacterium]MYB75699.1 hypothetical protein [Chloroflexota bacterium]
MGTTQEGIGDKRRAPQRDLSGDSGFVGRRDPECPEAMAQELSASVRTFVQAFEASLREFERRMTIRFGLMLLVVWGSMAAILKLCP